MEVLKNVLIKEVDGSKQGDKVFIVDNVPKELLYHKVIKLMVDYTNAQQPLVPEFEMDDRGRKKPTGAMVDELLPGIELSQTGDGGYVFHTALNEAYARLQTIDRYIHAKMPVAERIPTRIPYSTQPGVLTAGPRPLSDLPRVVLPEPVSPPVKAVQVAVAPTPVLNDAAPSKKGRKPMTEDQKTAARERMARARAAKKPKDEPVVTE